MIDGLAAALEPSRESALPELAGALDAVLAGVPGRVVGHDTFKRGVHRLRLESSAGSRSVVVKRLGLTQARRNELAFERWLPAAGLAGGCPALLGRAAERSGRFMWHVYEDLGDGALATDTIDPARAEAVIRLIARLHARFASHPMLAEARSLGGDLGIAFFDSNLRDAIHGLERLRPSVVAGVTHERSALRDRLAARIESLLGSRAARARAFAAVAGPETLLHGDLWTTNTLVQETPGGLRAALIDWDHAGAGPASYDLSTFLLRFPVRDRHTVFDLYRRAVEPWGWNAPGPPELNLLFDTAECARYANRLSWLALALLEGGNEWVWEKLALVEEWYEALAPVLPDSGRGARAA